MAPLLLAVAATAGCGSVDADGDQLPAGEPSAALTDLATLGRELSAELDRAGLESAATAIAEIDPASLFVDGEFTLLAPVDAAFLQVSADDLADLLADPDALLALLRNHVLPTTLDSGDLSSISSVETLTGRELEVNALDDGTLVIGGARIASVDARVGDGVVHTIDRLLIAEDAE